MAILEVRDKNGNIIEIPAIQGKSAYEYAKDGGYTGTEEEFATKLSDIIDLTNNLNCKGITSLPTTPENSFFFSCFSDVQCGSISIPLYSKGVYIDAGNDAVIIAVDSNNDLYHGYRNGSTWTCHKKQKEYDTHWTRVTDNCEYRAKNGVCTVKGSSWGGITLPSGAYHTIANIPAPYRPSANQYFTASPIGGDAGIFGQITTSGDVIFYTNSANINYWVYSVTYPI